MKNRRHLLVACFLAVGLLASPAWAQPGAGAQPVYTYVAEWGVPRAQWADMEKANAGDKAMMDSLVADGTLMGYGYFENRVHSDGGYTHGSWFQANSVGKIMKALEKFYASPASVTAPVQAESKHQDYLMVSTSYSFKPASNVMGYLRVVSVQLKPGHEEAFIAAWQRYVKPIYEKLMADGAIIAYQLDTEMNIQNAPGRIFSVIVARDADALSKIQETFAESFGNNPGALDALVSNAVPSSRFDLLARVTNMVHK